MLYSAGICFDGSPPVNCLVNPCKTASCPAVADATCVADYCGGCNARWILNGQEVTDQCHGKKHCAGKSIYIAIFMKANLTLQDVLMVPCLSPV